MSNPIALAGFALVAFCSCTWAATPPSNPLPADALITVLPGAHAEESSTALAPNRDWQPAQSATSREEDVEITGGPAAQPKLPRPQRIDGRP